MEKSLHDIFPVDKELVHCLPFPGLPSRLATALVLGLDDRWKTAVKKTMVLSKGARAFIITQDGCKGFILYEHVNSASWFYEF